MQNKIGRFTKLYPWYSGLSGDLLFYIAIDTLFLTVVKNFSPSQIVFITSFSQFVCIALQFPLLFVIQRIGNTNSIRAGAFCLLLSSILITVSKSFYLVLLGRVFHDVAAILRTASFVALENNLDLIDRRHDFVRLRTSANTVYSVITMIISFVASLMFNLNPYLPMIGCITTCATGFFLTLFMQDCSNYNKIPKKTQTGQRIKIHYSKFIIMAIVVYAIFYPIVTTGQNEGKLFIQQNLLLEFNTENTSLILGVMICISRIIRVFSNILFVRLYQQYQKKMGVVLPILLGCAIGFLLFGSDVPLVLGKIIIMSTGYVIILFVRDPFRVYMQDVIFENTPKEQHQTLLAVLEFGVKVGTAGMGLSFSAILLRFPMTLVMVLVFVIAVLEILLSIKLYNIVCCAKTAE